MNEQTGTLAKLDPMPVAPSVEPTTPQALMRRATDVASVCREIVLKTACEIQGRKFLRVEGWESIATAHGCFAGAEQVERVYDNSGNHIGYKAQGVLRNAHGEVIATGEGFVGFDEKDRKGNPTWKNRAEYAGKAMAQTRAISRTCRGVFAHVVVLIDAGLSTTPAEEVPDGGFDDNERAARAKPANPGTAKRADGAKAPSAALPEPDEAARQRWIGLLRPLGQVALDFCYEKGWLVAPTEDGVGEPLEVLGLAHVPKGKKQAQAILDEIQKRMDGDLGPQTPDPRAETPENPAKAEYERSEGLPEGVETVEGKLEAVSVKSGRSKRGPWTNYGLKVVNSENEVWAGTFDRTLGELAGKLKGTQVKIGYRIKDNRYELLSLEKVKD